MQAKHFFSMMVAAVAVGPMTYACSSSNHAQSQDGGLSDGTTFDVAQQPDSSAGTCPTPVDLTSFTPPPYVPALHAPGACSASDVAGFDAACINVTSRSSASCDSFLSMHSSCYYCLQSLRTSSSWGVFVVTHGSLNTDLNVAGCIELTNPSDATCPQAIEAANACVHAACDPVCPANDLSSLNDWQTCAARASTTPPCANYSQAALQCEMIDAGPSAVCVQDYGMLDGALEVFAPIFCGGGDAGAMASDGSTPESGAPDASSD